ncbi:lycopene beta-cyclase [Olea europaea subsp. europaea]|uniref:Lycopene beta-cyclase, partial n=1 Tax=Olea europaea subsp. europaea TaxID=158383 RepID=A0A8S0U3G9_OLEEU|nr:lycopene beta-cyclase [Olea europaea subsp. europaea]
MGWISDNHPPDAKLEEEFFSNPDIEVNGIDLLEMDMVIPYMRSVLYSKSQPRHLLCEVHFQENLGHNRLSTHAGTSANVHSSGQKSTTLLLLNIDRRMRKSNDIDDEFVNLPLRCYCEWVMMLEGRWIGVEAGKSGDGGGRDVTVFHDEEYFEREIELFKSQPYGWRCSTEAKENFEFVIPMYDPSKGLVVDLAVIGGDPAGLAAAVVLDETGFSRCLAQYDKPCIAYKIWAEVEEHPFDVNKMVFMDWNDSHLNNNKELKERNSKIPTFLYATLFSFEKNIP